VGQKSNCILQAVEEKNFLESEKLTRRKYFTHLADIPSTFQREKGNTRFMLRGTLPHTHTRAFF
jgi:hypothetical protein